MKYTVTVLLLATCVACVAARPRPGPRPGPAVNETVTATRSPALLQASRAAMDFIHHEQQAQVADDYAKANPTFVESNDTQGAQGLQQTTQQHQHFSDTPKKDWEMVPRNNPIQTTVRPISRYFPVYSKGHLQYGQAADAGLQTRVRRQAPVGAPDWARNPTQDREELVVSSNSVRVTKQKPPQRPRGNAPTPQGQ